MLNSVAKYYLANKMMALIWSRIFSMHRIYKKQKIYVIKVALFVGKNT